jgi:hypothetical protein
MSEAEKGPQGQKQKTYQLAIWSLGLAILSCAILAGVFILMSFPSLPARHEWLAGLRAAFLIFPGSYLVSLVLGIVSIFKIKKNKNELKGIRLAAGAVLADATIAVGIILGILFAVQPVIHRIVCGMNMEGLGKALSIYANDFDDKYPTPEKWCDLLIQYAEVTEKSFRCPSAKKGRSHYAINPDCQLKSPPDVVVLFETGPGWNQFGGPERLVSDRHWWRGSCVLFNNSQVQFIRKKDLGQLKWKSEVGDLSSDIHHLIWVGEFAKVQSILDKSPELVHSKNIFGQTLLHTAVLVGNKDIVELLLTKGAGNNADNRHSTSLHEAASKGREDIVELFLAGGFDMDTKDISEHTPLHLAALYGHRKVVELLIANGANVNSRDDTGRTPLKWAVERDHAEVAELLRKHGGVE